MIIQTPSSAKNASGERDEEMHQTKKGNQWYFGMKAHIGVDAGSGYTHTLTVTPANAHDITQASELIREDDETVYGDAGFIGIEKRPEIKSNEKKNQIKYQTNHRPSDVVSHQMTQMQEVTEGLAANQTTNASVEAETFPSR